VTNIGTSIDPDSDVDADGEDLEIERKASSTLAHTSAALKAVEQCLEALESVNTDEKLNALRALVQSIAAATQGQLVRICIVSRYADTVAYLNSTLQGGATPVFKLTGRDTFADRTATVEQFRREGGVLVGTDGGISEGIELGDIPHVVHYDLPLSAEAVEQRRGRVDRYGRTGPLTMYVFLDDSGAIPSEVEASDRLNALRSVIEKAFGRTDHVDTDDPVSH
jgi:superfamily II DNA/RNA helicase